MSRRNETLLEKAGTSGMSLTVITDPEAPGLHRQIGKTGTELEVAERKEAKALAKFAAARKKLSESPHDLAGMIRGAVLMAKWLRPDVTMPQPSKFDLNDPIVWAEEVAVELDDGGKVERGMAEVLRQAVADRASQLAAREAAAAELQLATQHRHTVAKELTALVSKAQVVIARSKPKEAFAKRHTGAAAPRRKQRTPVRPAAVVPIAAEPAPAPVTGPVPVSESGIAPAQSEVAA